MIEITALYASPSIDVNIGAPPVIEVQAAEVGGAAAARAAANAALGYRDEAEAAALAAEQDAQATINLAENLTVDVTTLLPGAEATATYDADLLKISFGLPRGEQGAQGIQGLPGPPGTNYMGGYTVELASLATGDHLEFAGTSWVNVPKLTLTDGGNF